MSPVTYDMSENEPENLVVIMHGRRRSFVRVSCSSSLVCMYIVHSSRVLNSGRIVRDDGSHYESEQLEVKWPTKCTTK